MNLNFVFKITLSPAAAVLLVVCCCWGLRAAPEGPAPRRWATALPLAQRELSRGAGARWDAAEPLSPAATLRSCGMKKMLKIWFLGNHILVHTQLLGTSNKSILRGSWCSVSKFSAVLWGFQQQLWPELGTSVQAKQPWPQSQHWGCRAWRRISPLQNAASCSQSLPHLLYWH